MNREKGGILFWVQKHAHKINPNFPTVEKMIDEMFRDIPQRFLPPPKTEQELLRENIDKEWDW